MRFYFDFVDGAYETHDADGHDLDCPEAVRAEVVRALPQVLLANPGDGEDRQVACSVRDGRGAIVCRATVTLAVRMLSVR